MSFCFKQQIIGSHFDYQKVDKKNELRCSYGWASSRGQQETEYSVDSIFINKKDLDAWIDNMPYVTQDITIEFYDKPPLNEEGKLTAEPCVLHDYNIGKFGELNLCFRINNFNTEVFRVKVPIDALKEEDLKKIIAGSKWFVKTSDTNLVKIEETE